ncbi:MAG: DNA repair protein RecO [Candidatus Marinimicrobia bacterium]|jgi:recombinational DNA repair protein (RecF pathway)|nr:DNA repair protein RecO [Candidatus Neomarinimicrobiota bacterium]|tara:strand:+ start:1967 stop:2653 length:687 start_codon:yes stop_codon:yes gene_type:complete
MIVHTSAIVLKSFPYGDTSLIARCFSKDQGKISLIIKGARSKKKPKAAFFEPLSHVDLIYNYKPNRELQIVSKVSFINYWSSILSNLRSITLSMAMLELTEKTLSVEDPHPNLFKMLKDVLSAINEKESDPNLLFWFYECILLSHLGFRPNLEQNDLPGLNLPDLDNGPNSRLILASLLAERLDDLPTDPITEEDRKTISKYLWISLCYHFEGLSKVKSFQVARKILS